MFLIWFATRLLAKAEYHISRLDIVSEEQFTIFKEDLENAEALLTNYSRDIMRLS